MKLKHLIILSCCVFSMSMASAQKPEKLKTKTEKGRDGMSIIEYQVIKSHKKTKHGSYEKTNTIYDQLVVSGTYKFGKKDGLWEEWWIQSKLLKSKGYYKNDNKVGVWEYTDMFGKPLHTYNHDTNILIFDSSCGMNYPRDILVNGKKVSKELDCVPDLLGGFHSLMNEITFAFYSDKANSKKTGNVSVGVFILITKDGTIGEINVNGSSSLSPEFVDFINDKINNPEFVWLPGKLESEKVDSYASFSLNMSSFE